MKLCNDYLDVPAPFCFVSIIMKMITMKLSVKEAKLAGLCYNSTGLGFKICLRVLEKRNT